MNDEIVTPTSPELPVRDTGIVKTKKEFSDSLTQDLTDEEIQRAMQLMLPIKQKWQRKFISRYTHETNFNPDQAMKLVDEFEKELVATMAEKANLIVSVDVVPLLEGKPLVIEYVGVLPGHSASKGFDHERKAFEVKKAVQREEDWYGQKGPQDGTAKQRDKRNSRS